MTAPGWYPDPENPGAQRWWDGTAWAPPAQPSAPYPAQPYGAPAVPYGWTPPPARTPVEAVQTCLRKFATFSGRASRSEFWWFYAALIVLNVALSVLPGVLAGLAGAGSDAATVISLVFSVVTFAVSIALIIPTLAVGARRLHDLGQSGWLLLLFLVPCVNIGMLIYLAFPGQPGPNAYDTAD
jgi:uncharacterized membrane protein YhaH (DUF805 family)